MHTFLTVIQTEEDGHLINDFRDIRFSIGYVQILFSSQWRHVACDNTVIHN